MLLGFTERPDAPTFNSLVPGRRNVTVSWASTFDGNSPIQRFTITYRSINGSNSTVQTAQFFGSTAGTLIENLEPFAKYTFSLTATNLKGTSATVRQDVQTEDDSKYIICITSNLPVIVLHVALCQNIPLKNSIFPFQIIE